MTILSLSISNTAPTATLGEQAERRLRESAYFYLRSIRCDYADGVLTLRGRVPYSQLRDFAEDIVARVPGIEEIANCLEVVDPLRPPIAAPGLRNAG